MAQTLLKNVFSSIARLGTEPGDSDDVRVIKVIMVTVVIGGFGIIAVWSVSYQVFHETVAVGLLVIQGVLSFLSLFLFGLRRISFRSYYLSQFLIIFFFPFLIMLALGGIVNSSGLIAWCILAPMGILVTSSAREAARWFVGYTGLVILSLVMQPYLRPENNLPDAMKLIFWGMNTIAPSAFLFLTLYYFVTQRDQAYRLLRGEQEKSENLLLNILPRDIAAILKNENRVIADHFDGASILFADVVNFTPMSATMTPVELVDLLNEVFSHFDALVEKYGLEKIKTIGDCYMVASGVPRPRHDHAQALTRMALEMQDFVRRREFHGRRLAFRIGINSGPVVAGVIGRKKFIYDLWGDAVNTASRMESHGQGGLIQITRETYELIKDDFDCEPRGTVHVKGKGEMDVWRVTSLKELMA
jgi:guanylate cyclase